MTYNEWLNLHCKATLSNAYNDAFFETDLKQAWNAAIDAASRSVENVDFTDSGKFLHDIIKALEEN